MDKIQKIMNKSAKYVLNYGWRWKTRQLMEEVKWLDAK